MSFNELRSGPPEAPLFRDYLAVLRARRWSILAIALVTVGGALFFSLRQTPIYSSSAEVLVKPTTECTFGPCFNLQTETVLAQSPEVAGYALELLPSSDSVLDGGLTVTHTPETEILVFAVAHSDRRSAKEQADAYAQGYLAARNDQAIDQIEQATESVAKRVSQLEGRLGKINEKLAATTDTAERTTLTQRSGFIRLQIQSLKQKLTEVNAAAFIDVGQVVQDARLPLSPVSPQPRRSAALGLVLGLILGCGLALLRDRLDNRLKGRADLEMHAGASVLAVVPHIRAWKKRDKAYVVTLEDPQSTAAEAYRTLRTAILFAATQRDIKTLMVTSADEDEGKTATSANLGVVLSQAGKRVVMVSADLRKPRLHRFIEGTSNTGVTNVLAGELSVAQAMRPVAGLENMRMLPSGPVPGNPAELLGSEEMAKLLAELRAVADFVLVDVAPVLPVTDAMTVVTHCDAVLFVADATKTTGSAVERARQQLDQVNARLVGAVLNNFDARKAKGSSEAQDGYYAYRHEPRRKIALLPRRSRDSKSIG